MNVARKELLDVPGDDTLAEPPRVIDPKPALNEEGDEAGLRPRSLAEFVGQAELVGHLSIVLEAARRRGQPSDHLLFAGPPGLGKTTLAGSSPKRWASGYG